MDRQRAFRRRLVGAWLVLMAGASSMVPLAMSRAQKPDQEKAAGESGAVRNAVGLLTEQLRKHPAPPSLAGGHDGLFLIDASGGEATLIASEPEPWLNQCGSPNWSPDGRRIVFDATPGNANFGLSRLKSIELADGHLSLRDLGPGNCPSFSPTSDRLIFLLNPGRAPADQSGVWLMQADGSGRGRLSGYGRPRWSPDGHRFLIVDFSNPCEVTVIDDRPGNRSGILSIGDQKVFSPPNWAGDGSIVAVLGTNVGDTIALVDITDPEQARVKEVLWSRDKGPDVLPSHPIYSPASGRCVFVGKVEGKGRALYGLERGKATPAKRLESEGFDNLIQDPAFSPDGRYVVFSSDRAIRSGAGDRVDGRRPSVDAPVLSAITIDGDLKDWPPAIERHAIRNLETFPPRNGPGGLEHALLSTSPDLSASFSVGYDPTEQLIYVGVIVRDDALIAGNTSSWDTDAVEVYVDGLHRDTKMPYPNEPGWVENMDASEMPVLQYIGIPGKGPVYGVKKSAGEDRSGDDNPILMFGDIKKTRTRMAFRRERDVTTYEWAIQAFDRYPDKPTRLVAGMRLGFDVAISDKDVPAKTPLAANDPEPDQAAWICWGPIITYGDFKGFNATRIGEIVLGRMPNP